MDISTAFGTKTIEQRTLNIGNGLLKDLLEGLWVLKLLLDLGNDALGKLLLLALLDLSLVTDPRVKDSLSLGGQSSALGDIESLSLKLGSLLGNLEEGLGDINDTTHLLDVLDALLDGLGVVGTGRVQDTADLLDLGVGPLAVHWSGILSNGVEDGKEGEGDNGLLVDDVVLVGEGVNGGTGGRGEDGSLRDKGVAWERVDDGLSLLLWLLGWDVRGVVANRAGQSRDSPHWSSWTETCRAYATVRRRRPIEVARIAIASRYVPKAVFAKRDAIVI